jgi:hypothetical protein
MLCPKAQERDRLISGNERVRDHKPVPERQPRDCVTVEEREQHRTLELARVIQRGELPNNVSLIGVSEPQLDPRRIPLTGAARGLMPTLSRPTQISYVFIVVLMMRALIRRVRIMRLRLHGSLQQRRADGVGEGPVGAPAAEIPSPRTPGRPILNHDTPVATSAKRDNRHYDQPVPSDPHV